MPRNKAAVSPHTLRRRRLLVVEDAAGSARPRKRNKDTRPRKRNKDATAAAAAANAAVHPDRDMKRPKEVGASEALVAAKDSKKRKKSTTASAPVERTPAVHMKAFEDVLRRRKLTPSATQRHTWQRFVNVDNGSVVREAVLVAPTGTGKTLAYLLPCMRHSLLSGGSGLKVLVACPTRELAKQIVRDWKVAQRASGLRAACFTGGEAREVQLEAARRPETALLVGTPGRLVDLCLAAEGAEVAACPLGSVTMLVLDEADKLLEMGFEPEVQRLRQACGAHLHTWLITATLGPTVVGVVRQWMASPLGVQVSSGGGLMDDPLAALPLEAAPAPDTDQLAAESVSGPRVGVAGIDAAAYAVSSNVTQTVHVCAEHKKPKKLMKFIHKVLTEDRRSKTRRPRRILIFCNKIKAVGFVHGLLAHGDLPVRCGMLHSLMSQQERDRALADFSAAKTMLLVATDVAGRGVHVRNLPIVVNYDFPSRLQTYVHRIGRTGRLGGTNRGGSTLGVLEQQQDGEEQPEAEGGGEAMVEHGAAYSFFTRNLMQIATPLVGLLESTGQEVDPNLRALSEEHDRDLMLAGPGAAGATADASNGDGDDEDDDQDDQDDEGVGGGVDDAQLAPVPSVDVLGLPDPEDSDGWESDGEGKNRGGCKFPTRVVVSTDEEEDYE